MKYFLSIVLFCLSTSLLKAQNTDFEIKVVSKKYQSVKGKLQKVSPEGIAIEDYKGNYLIFRADELIKIKVRKRGLTIGTAAGSGTLSGLVVGASIWSLDENNESIEDMAKLTGVLVVSGAAIGTITGIVAEIANNKLILNIDGDMERFKKNYKKLEKYINIVRTENFNSY